MQHAKTKRVSRKSNKKSYLAPVLICALALAIILSQDAGLLAWDAAWPRLIKPLLRMLGYLGVGLLVGIVIEATGWSQLLARTVRPLMRFGRLNDTCGAAFATAFFSGTAANTMLMQAHTEGRLTAQEMRLAYLVNTGLPVFLLHLPTTFFIVVPMTRQAGAVYLTISGIAAMLRTLLLLLFTRSTLSSRRLTADSDAKQPDNGAKSHTSSRSTFSAIAKSFHKRFQRIITITAPVYFLIYACNQAGVFAYLRDTAASWVSTSLLPVEAASVVVFAVAAEFTSGIAAAGALLDAGTLTTAQTVFALVLGTVVATPIRALRHQLPSMSGVFSPSLALPMLLQSQLLRITTLLAATAAYLAFAL